jgi:hypothetical protein
MPLIAFCAVVWTADLIVNGSNGAVYAVARIVYLFATN